MFLKRRASGCFLFVREKSQIMKMRLGTLMVRGCCLKALLSQIYEIIYTFFCKQWCWCSGCHCCECTVHFLSPWCFPWPLWTLGAKLPPPIASQANAPRLSDSMWHSHFLSPIVPRTRPPSGGLVIAKLREMFLGHSFREQPDESVLTRSVLGDDKFGLHKIYIIQRTRTSDKKLSEVQPCCIECVWKSWMHWLNGSNVRAVDFKRDIDCLADGILLW